MTRNLLALAAATTTLALAAASPALAAGELINSAGMTAPEVADWLKKAGYAATLDTDAEGDPMVRSAVGEIKFSVFLYDCESKRCRAIQFSTGFDLDSPLPLAKINEWNMNNRYMKAYIDSDGDPYVQYDVNVNAGRTFSGLEDDFSIWTSFLDDFAKFVGW